MFRNNQTKLVVDLFFIKNCYETGIHYHHYIHVLTITTIYVFIPVNMFLLKQIIWLYFCDKDFVNVQANHCHCTVNL